MNEIKVWRLFICPQTHIRTNYNETWLVLKDDEYLRRIGMKKTIEEKAAKKNAGSPNRYIHRRDVIKRYWDYKRALKIIADSEKFTVPTSGSWWKFFIPMPKSWTKKKKKELCFQLHESTPDVDNFLKAAIDSLMGEDKTISDIRVSKFWYDGTGHIEITVGELPVANGYTPIKREDKIK